ncbi:CCR4-NOT transcription complex subunit 2-like isoform X3 [Corticium candelabrum]|uniref:CCR4-NOT transcription complex subunit 2-like isoform X3 n=1 Tax=Corticium candelabrum TaxID=121492 RepID=UPI002E259FAF|nr:CCR4-NOT transcription complex subunit 2-like isoform X3 [Corticium candelabrum]
MSYRYMGENLQSFSPFSAPLRNPPEMASPVSSRKGLGGIMQMQPTPTPTQMKKTKVGFFGDRLDDMEDDMGLGGSAYFGQSMMPLREKELFSRFGGGGGMYGGATAGPQTQGMYSSGFGLGSTTVSGSQYSNPVRSSQFPTRSFSSSSSSGNLSGLQTPMSSGPPGAPGSPAISRNGFAMGSHGLLSQGFSSAPGQFGSVATPGVMSNNRTGLGGLGMMSSMSGSGSNLAIGSKHNRPPHIPLGLGGTTNGMSNTLGLSSIYSSSRPSQGMMSPNFPMGDTTSPPNQSMTFNMSDFPALSQQRGIGGNSTSLISGSSSGFSSAMPMPMRSSYGFVTKPPEQPQEFQMHHEDFPALPGATHANQSTETSGNEVAISESNKLPFHIPSSLSSSFGLPDSRAPGSAIDIRDNGSRPAPVGGVIGQKPIASRLMQQSRQPGPPSQQLTQQSSQQPAQTPVNQPGSVTLPAGMVTDQFGMLGLLTFIRAAETDPDLVSLALGSDLTTLGLNLNSPENLYSTFASPFAEAPLRPKDMDYSVPPEYLTNAYIRDKLPPPNKLNRYPDDLLFYLYYNNGGDLFQLAVTAELYARDWRYHKEERIWITRMPGIEPAMKTTAYERGTYYFFDCQNWRKAAKEFHLDYDKLEDRPILPSLGPAAVTPVGVVA